MALKDKVGVILSVKDSPHRISLAFSLGVFIGMSPLIGLHTVLGIFVAWVFRLNKLVTIMGVFVTNPWTIVPIYTFSTWVGAKCLGIEKIVPDIDWNGLTLRQLVDDFSSLIMPFVVGTILIGAVSAVVSYVVVYRLSKRRHG